MLAPLNWLSQYVKLKSTTADLADRLTLQAAEVEEIIEPNQAVQTARVALVTKISPHPNADRLKLVEIKVGGTTKTVVCGAPNVSVDMVAPYVPKGGYYYDHDNNLLTLAKATIRGIESDGMLASEHDLGLSDQHDGIMVLPKSAGSKKSLVGALNLYKPVFKLEITPNRSDLFSMIGLAREISFIEKSRLSLPTSGTFNHHDPRIMIKPEVQTDNCQRYCTIVVEGNFAEASPSWITSNLRQADIRPISPAVDVTNFVMLECGQPLHAFDYDALAKNNGVANIIVRQAKKAELFEALDGNTYELDPKDTVIADNDGVIALAGIIGGKKAAVSNSTKSIVLESALFHPGNTRRTANRLGIRTESLTRFEKGIDPELQVLALKRAASLLKDICQAEPRGKLFDLNFIHKQNRNISISLERIRQIVGVSFDKQFAKNSLSILGFQVTSTSQHGLKVIPPSWRLDIEREEDIIEELVRLYGYDNLPNTLPVSNTAPLTSNNGEYYRCRSIRYCFTAAGFDDIISQPFLSKAEAKLLGVATKELVEVANPTSLNEQYLRSEIMPLLIKRNMVEAIQHQTVRAFELGHVFTQKSGHLNESLHLGIAAITGDAIATVRAIKGLLNKLGPITETNFNLDYKSAAQSMKDTNVTSELVYLGKVEIGNINLYGSEYTQKLKLKGERYLITAELKLDDLLTANTQILKYQPPSIYPASSRDFSLSLLPSAKADDVLATIGQAVPNLINLEVIDEYHSDDIRAITIRVTLQSKTKTLTEKEIDQAVEKIRDNIATCSEVELRT